jgi:hypothetical protein
MARGGEGSFLQRFGMRQFQSFLAERTAIRSEKSTDALSASRLGRSCLPPSATAAAEMRMKTRYEGVDVGELIALEHELDIDPRHAQRADNALTRVAQPQAPAPPVLDFVSEANSFSVMWIRAACADGATSAAAPAR